MKGLGNLAIGVCIALLALGVGWMMHTYSMEVTNEVPTVVSHDVYSDLRSPGVCLPCCELPALEAATPTPTEPPVCPVSSPTDTPPTATPRPTRGPTDVPTATPSPDPTDTPKPEPTAKVKCNNGGGNGSEGCSASDKGHDDEDQGHKHGGGHK